MTSHFGAYEQECGRATGMGLGWDVGCPGASEVRGVRLWGGVTRGWGV